MKRIEISKSAAKKQMGQGMTEYIIIVALIAVAAIGVYSYFGTAIRQQMAGITNEVAGKSGGDAIGLAGAAATAADTAAAAKKGLSNYDKDNIQK